MTNSIRLVRTRRSPLSWRAGHDRQSPDASQIYQHLVCKVSRGLGKSGTQAPIQSPKAPRPQGNQAASRVHLLYVSPPPSEIPSGLSFLDLSVLATCNQFEHGQRDNSANLGCSAPFFLRVHCPILFDTVSRRVPWGAFRPDVQTIPNSHIHRDHSLTDTRPLQLQSLEAQSHIPSQHGGGQPQQPVIDPRGG